MTVGLDHLAEIVAWLTPTNIEILELSGPAVHVRLRRAADGTVIADAPRGDADEAARLKTGAEIVPSPGVGLFLHSHPLREEPFARPGDRVKAGQTVGLLQIGALLIPVPAPLEGVVAALTASDRSLVGYGDCLMNYAQSSEGHLL
jgi:acetyl-CoA carboxylase biotin carboxyl carrier protein